MLVIKNRESADVNRGICLLHHTDNLGSFLIFQNGGKDTIGVKFLLTIDLVNIFTNNLRFRDTAEFGVGIIDINRRTVRACDINGIGQIVANFFKINVFSEKMMLEMLYHFVQFRKNSALFLRQLRGFQLVYLGFHMQIILFKSIVLAHVFLLKSTKI